MDLELQLAEKFFKNKEYSKALILFEKLYNKYPENYLIPARIGLIYQFQNNVHKAISFYEKSLNLNPNQKEILNNLGSLYISINKYHEAINCFRKIVEDYEGLFNLGILFEKIGKIKQAKKCFYNAIKVNKSKKFSLNTKIAFLIPPIYKSVDEIVLTRKRIENYILRHLDDNEIIENPIYDIGTTTFYLGYHGLCNKDINTKIAEFYLNHLQKDFIVNCESVKKGKRVKIGFISTFFRKHSVSDVSNNWISKLNSKYFEKIVFSIGKVEDSSVEILKKSCDKVLFLPRDLNSIQQAILNEKLNILFYTDIGLEPFTYFLAFSKLAPVQVTYTGHPDTTGIPSIDFYISSKFWEMQNSNTHYSENLIKANSLTWDYNKPVLKKLNLTRLFFGFNEQDNIYCLNQSLFKIHPHFDKILNKIIENDKKAKIAIFYDEAHYWWKDMLLERFKNTIIDLSKIKFIPKLKFDYYLNFVKLSDVVLDTIYFNGGTTSLQTFSIGTPIITMPTELMRGRFTYGMYLKMGIDDLIADNFDKYSEIAIEIANNKDKQKKFREKILSKNYILFNDENVVKDFEKIFLEIA